MASLITLLLARDPQKPSARRRLIRKLRAVALAMESRANELEAADREPFRDSEQAQKYRAEFVAAIEMRGAALRASMPLYAGGVTFADFSSGGA